MNERGVDTHKIKYGKAEAALWGIEHLNKAKKKEAAMIKTSKAAVEKAGEKTASILDLDEDGSLRKLKREVIHGRGRPG